MVNFVLKCTSGFSSTILNITNVRAYSNNNNSLEIFDNHQEMLVWVPNFSFLKIIDEKTNQNFLYLMSMGIIAVQKQNITDEGIISNNSPLSTCVTASADYAYDISENPKGKIEQDLSEIKNALKLAKEEENTEKIEILEENEQFLEEALKYIIRVMG
jgi:hypothetical protein